MGAVTKKVFSGILSHYYEKLFIAFEKPSKAAEFLIRHVNSDDLEILRRSLSRKNGVIFVTAHYGAIEFLPALLAVNGFSVSMIAKFKSGQLKKKVHSQAKIYNIELIDAESTQNVVAAAFNELRKSRILITQCDEIEAWKPSKREWTSFLGQRTGVDRSINLIRRRTGAEVVFGIIHRYSHEAYKLIMCDYEHILERLDPQLDVSAGEAVLRFLEQRIRAHPDQWYQWQKYPNIPTSPSDGDRIEKPCPSLMLRPAFG